MNQIDWEKLKKSVVEIERNETPQRGSEAPKMIEYVVDFGEDTICMESQLNNYPKNKYEARKRLLEYYKLLQCHKYKTEEVKELIKCVYDALINEFGHLRKAINNDIKELDLCFSVKAYKATLILAGSILEAFLLDWLSEIDGKDYFSEPYMVEVVDHNGEKRMERKEGLNFYIEQIKDIERPDWMVPSEKAHFIRKSRNSVHAKVCLREEIGINDDSCKKVIEYLKDIINTRNKKREKELQM